jgi:hypothetical protein
MQAETPKVYAAIVAVMADIGKEGIAKGSRNQQQGYNFRGIDAVYNALSALLARHRLCILPRVLGRTVSEQTAKSGGMLFYVVLDVEFDFVSAEDGSKHTVRAAGEAMDSGDKATNKAMSAAYKYACMQAFCIPTEGDNDADATTHEVVRVNPRPPQEYSVDQEVREEWVDAIRRNLSFPKQLLGIHEELNQDTTMYPAVVDRLNTSEKKALREGIIKGRELAKQVDADGKVPF